MRSCGYVSSKKDGTEWPKGMNLGAGGGRAGKGRPGRQLSYATKVQFNGNLLVGKAYTAQLGLEPGDEPLGAAEEE